MYSYPCLFTKQERAVHKAYLQYLYHQDIKSKHKMNMNLKSQWTVYW